MTQLSVQPPQTVLFLHIPKAAGTTLGSILDREYPAEATYVIAGRPQDTVTAFCELPVEQRHKIRMLRGHMGFGLHTYCASPTTYLTFLREPVARVISTYDYIRRTPVHTHYRRLMTGPMTLMDFVREGVSKVGVDNGQTRLLSGAPRAGDEIGFRECTRDLLEQAKTNLRASFAVVGLMEFFDASLLLAQAALGWQTPYYISKNATKEQSARTTITDADRAVIAEYNQLDLELYACAQELLKEQIQRQGPLFPLRVKAFAWRNRRQHP